MLVKKYFLLIIISLLFFTSCSFGVGEARAALPDIPGVNQPTDFVSYVKYLYLLMLYVVGLTAFGVLVYAGFVYIMADTVFSKEEAKKWFTGAIAGLILALAAWLILNTINPDLVNWQLEV